MPTTWLDQKHPKYKGDQWKTVRAHLRGTILQELGSHLVEKGQGEAREAYQARKEIASYVPHYTRAVLALAGMIIQNESEMSRQWWPDDSVLGSPSTEGSVMSRLWRDVDGKGTDWEVLRTQSLVDQVGYQQVWTLIEGVGRRGSDGDSPTLADAVDHGKIRLIDPMSVYDWATDETGRVVEVKVHSKRNTRTSVRESSEPEDIYHVFTLDGVEIWREADGEPTMEERRPYGPNGFQYQGRDGRPTLPIYRTKVPVRSPVGYMMAKYAEWLFNFRNVRNFHLWSSALARMYTDATDSNDRFDEDTFTKFQDLLKEGSSFFPKEVGYAAPPMDGASARNETLEQETDNFYSVFFQSFGDVARERTATEINQQVAQSVGAYLTLQTQSLDEWENDALWRIAQVHAPGGGPDLWRQASVERSTDFSHVNVGERLQNIAESAFESKVPLGPEGRKNAAMKFADELGIDVLEGEVVDEVQAQSGRESLLRRFREQQGENGALEL